jgi:sulfate transport system substrate-binding protein
VVGLALAADVYKLQDKGLVDLGWERELPNQSIITNSTVALFVRPGNPKNIQSWNDLDNKNVDVITANPKTSGGARWNFAALWGSVTQTGGGEDKAKNFITTVYKNVDVLPKDAREATDTFVKRRKGDVLLNYENEAILARKTGEWTEPVKIPSPNILIEGPITVVDKNVNKHGTRKVAEAFARFLYTPAAQKAFVDSGFRPVTIEGKAYAQGKFPAINTWRITKLGGWKVVDLKFFSKGGLWDQIFAKSR